MIDRAISIVVAMMVFLLASIILYVSVFSGMRGELTLSRHTYEREYGELLLQSVLLSTEPTTRASYETLLARAMQTLDPIVTTHGTTINVRDALQAEFDGLLGADEYYLSIAPVLKGVSVSYVLDGSETMHASRQTVATALPALIDDLQEVFGEDAAVYTHLYILDTPTGETWCHTFTLPPEATCEDLSGETLYTTLQLQGFSPPFPAPYRSYSEWVLSSKAATASHLSQSDWASGAAYAAHAYERASRERASTNTHVVVTVADELSSTSKADICFGKTNANDFLFCLLCDASCPILRAQRVVNQTAQILADGDHLFIGFSNLLCDYTYDTTLDGYALTPYTCGFLDDRTVCRDVKDLDDPETPPTWVNPPANVNWCMQDACVGCNPDAGGQYCFHRQCDAAIIDDLQRLADATDGVVLPLDDLDALTERVSEYLSSQVAQFDFHIGVRDTARDRYVLQHEFILPDGAKITVDLWIYDSPESLT